MSVDSAASENIIGELLETEWMQGTVGDYFNLNYYTLPQPINAHSFTVTKVVPYLKDLCTN